MTDTFVVLAYTGSQQISFKNDSAFFFWIKNYYADPKPACLLDAFKYYVTGNLINDNILYTPLIYFFSIGFKNNPFLCPCPATPL